jgi:hypothetical protein
MDTSVIINSLLADNINLKNNLEKANEEIQKLKEHLKKYTAPARRKKYYEAHKGELLEKTKKYDYVETKEQRREYNKKYYLKKKEKKNDKGKEINKENIKTEIKSSV